MSDTSGFSDPGPEDHIVIDVLDRDAIDELCRAFPDDWSLVNDDGTIDSEVINAVQQALQDYANTPPPPIEPSGLGAVVTAKLPHGAAGVTMIRISTWDEHKKPWQAQGGSTGFSWDEMTNVTVHSEGWER